uniref:C2H2-type domain-containing protein n=1 Tax=Plectus sambesii TaxID=2011161 RepID=A0A914W6X8_9BILA
MSRRKQLKPKSLRSEHPFSSRLTVSRQGATDDDAQGCDSVHSERKLSVTTSKVEADDGLATAMEENAVTDDNLPPNENIISASPKSAMNCNGNLYDNLNGGVKSEQRKNSSSSSMAGATFSCELCDQTFKNVGSLQRHTLSIHSVQDIRSGLLPVGSDPVYRCNYCPRKFDAILSLHKHVSNTHHDAEKMERTRLSINAEDNLFMCAHCDIALNSLTAFANHMREHVKKTDEVDPPDIRCDFCPAAFNKQTDMDRHMMEHFLTKTTRFFCHACADKSFENSIQLRNHLTNDHSVPIYKCRLCQKMFDFKADVEMHMLNTHAEEKTQWRCEACQIVLDSLEKFAVHVQVEHNRRAPPTRCSSQSSTSSYVHKGEREGGGGGVGGGEYHLRSGRSSHSDTMQEAFRCPTCHQSFSVEFLFERHMQIEHGGIHSTVANQQHSWSLIPVPSTNAVYVKCNVCDRKCESVQDLAEHKLIHCKVVRATHCGVCLEPLNTIDLYYQHTRRHNHDSGPMNCIVCKQSLVDPIELDVHAKFHLNQAHKPEICGNSAGRSRELLEEKQYACIKCQQAFTTEQDIRAHVTTHLLQEGFQHHCLLCHQIFNSPARLQCHLIEHSFAGCSEFQCYLCGMVFSLSQPLQQHMFTHSLDDRPYDCSQCDQRFFFRAELQNHQFSHPPTLRSIDVKQVDELENVQSTASPAASQRSHSAEKNKCDSNKKSSADHRCSRCLKVFSSLSALQGHSHVHMNNRLHRCDKCGLGFTTPSKLITHKRRHSGEKPFMCRICDRNFSRKDNLKAHMRSHGASLESAQSRVAHDDEKPDQMDVNDSGSSVQSSSASQRNSTLSDDECSSDKI